MATKNIKQQFPKKLFVYRETDGDDSYLITCETDRECASLDEARIVGVYELKEVGKVLVNVVQVSA